MKQISRLIDRLPALQSGQKTLQFETWDVLMRGQKDQVFEFSIGRKRRWS